MCVGVNAATSIGIEIGDTSGTATSPFLDFHSGATAVGYDCRLQASGGTGGVGGGILSFAGKAMAYTAGSESAPIVYFVESGTGFYRVGGNQLGISAAGSNVATINSTGLIVTGVGTFSGDLNANGNIVGDTATTVTGMNYFRGELGSRFTPTYSYTNDTNTGFYLASAGNLSCSINGTQKTNFSASSCTFFQQINMGGNNIVSVGNVAGTLSTAAQPNVTSLRSHSVPTGSDDLVTTDSTDTLINKTITATTNTVTTNNLRSFDGSDIAIDGTAIPVAGQVLTASGATTANWTAAVPTVTNNTNNYLVTATGGASVNGESNLTFDGTTLQSGVPFKAGFGSTSTDLLPFVWNLPNHTLGTRESYTGYSFLSGNDITTYSSGTHSDIEAVRIKRPDIVVDGSVVVTNAYNLRIPNPPTEATNNYALYVDSGVTHLGGNINTGDSVAGIEGFRFYHDPSALLLPVSESGANFYVSPGDFTAAASGTHAEVFGGWIDTPNITIGTASVSTAYSLAVGAAPTEAGTNYALHVGTGESLILGDLTVNGDITTSALIVNGNQVVSSQGSAVSDATDAASAITQLNALLARLRTHGLIAT